MLAALQAVRETLAPLGYPVHLLSAEGASDAEAPPVPYLVLGVAPGLGLVPGELPLCGPDGTLEFTMRVTAVGYPADSPPKVQSRVRELLAPGLGGSRVPAVGRVVDLTYQRTEVASQVDRDVTAAGLNRHPSRGVDTYTVHVQPA